MKDYTTLFAFGAVVVAYSLILWQQRSHYNALLDRVEADNRDLRDRMFATRNLPPAGVDMKAEREEKQQERRQRAADPTLKSAPDPTYKMRQTLAARELDRTGGRK